LHAECAIARDVQRDVLSDLGVTQILQLVSSHHHLVIGRQPSGERLHLIGQYIRDGHRLENAGRILHEVSREIGRDAARGRHHNRMCDAASRNEVRNEPVEPVDAWFVDTSTIRHQHDEDGPRGGGAL
jgi:hypothetical protein